MVSEAVRAVRPTVTSVPADAPIKDIHTFVGTFTLHSTSPDPEQQQGPQVTPLTAENMLWSNTVLAAGTAIGMVIYTGKETRAVMNTSHPETKVGLLDLEINRVAKVSGSLAHHSVIEGQKILCAVTFALSVLLVALNGFRGQWYIYVFRFLILFSSIIPIRLVPELCIGT